MVPTLIKPSPPSAAPNLSPSGSMDDSSTTSSNSEPLSPERVGLGDEASKQRRKKKKKRRGHSEVYDFLDSQENNIGQSCKHGMLDKGGREAEEDEDEDENWEWEIRESGGGGRVKSKKTKSRARLPDEWVPPQQPMSPTMPAATPTKAANATSASSDSSALNSSSGPVLFSPTAQIPTSFTNPSHASLATDSPPRSYEPMCVDEFPSSPKIGEKANKDKVPVNRPEQSSSSVANVASKSGIAGDVNSSLALMTGDNLSPISQTFSFLDSVLQTPPGSTPDSQTTTPVTNTPSLAAAALTRSSLTEALSPISQANSVFTNSKSTPDLLPTSALPTSPSPPAAAITQPPTFAVGSALDVNAKPSMPSATLTMTAPTPFVNTAETMHGTTASASTTTTPAVMPLKSPGSPCKKLATATPPLDTHPKSVAMAISPAIVTHPPSVTPAVPPSLTAQSEHQESSSSQLPPLEGW